jgi:hypothetical protein
MLQIVIILGWLIALGLMMYLGTQAVKRRLFGRQKRKLAFRKIRQFRRHHHFDEKGQQWLRKADGMALVDEAHEDRRLTLVFVGWTLLVLWEGYWFWEIAERVHNAAGGRLDLPIVFLFFILVVFPLAVYLFFRRRLRRSAQLMPTRQG